MLALPFAGIQAQRTPTGPAHRAILDAFAGHEVVLLGESHRSANFHRFFRELVQAPRFARVVNDIVIEFGNMRYQPILDRYIAGDSVPRDSLALVWRNSTQLLAWDSPLYEQLLVTVRDVNRSLPVGRRVRVLAGDPPIDWSRTNAASDIPPAYASRDIETLRMLEREVFARHRTALVLIGGVHVYRDGPGDRAVATTMERAALGDQLARSHPGSTYIIESVFGDSRPPLVRLLDAIAFPGELVRVTGTGLADSSSSVLFGANITRFKVVNGERVPLVLRAADFPTLGRTLDALVYVNRENPRLLASPSVYREGAAYVAEIRRRIAILSALCGGDFWTQELEQQLRGEVVAP